MTSQNPPETGTGPVRRSREIEPLTLVAILLRHRRLLVLIPLAFGILSVIITLLTPREYEADFSFMPQQPDASSQMGNLAAQFGVRLGGFSEAESPTFYGDLIHSRTVLQPLTEREFSFPTDTGQVRGSFAQLYDIDLGSAARTTERSIREMRGLVRAYPDDKIGVVEVQVRTLWAGFSHQLAEAILEGINDFNVEVRRSRAQSERRFAELRLEEAQGRLLDAEAALQSFMESNQRGIETSAQLRTRFDRLQRQVGHQQALVTSMMQAYEQARLDEVRNTPVITVIEAPQLPASPASRGGLIRLIVALLLGLMVAGAVIAAREYIENARSSRPQDLEAVRDLGRQALGDLSINRSRRG